MRSNPASHAPNRLAREVSPYLQQHANNPVDWYPWGDEALALAKREDKPILLSIGYSACHWCHVMERESFEDDATAAVMNAGYVCIKVDREERPDLDQIYQLVVQLMGRSGGWPLTVFLTPEQKPFFGGTYFPPVDKYGMPGFPKILAAVLDAFRTKRGEIDEQAVEITQAIATATEAEARSSGPMNLSTEMLVHAAKQLEGRFDDTHGGFGSRPKFPSTMALSVMLRHAVVNGDERAKKRVVFALDSMRAGGIYDQLGGGFHRYSTDEKWLVPHFEKMLYDNALLLRLYVEGWRATKEARFADTAREIAAYVLREMTHATGAFFSTQDADSEGVEGKFFVWTAAEIRAALGADQEAADLAIARWGVTDEGNFEETGATVLHQAATIAALAVRFEKAPSQVTAALERARASLLAARETRVKPMRDEKVLACWNGLMIGALADAGAALGDETLIHAAARALSFVTTSMITPDGAIQRVAKDGVVKASPAFLDDYAYLADAALDLYEATGDLAHATLARRLGERMVARFWNRDTRAFYFTPDGGETLIHRAKDSFDHATPSATAIACKALLRLPVAKEGEPPYAKLAAAQLEQLAGAALENPFGMSESLLAMDRLARGEVTIVIAGDRKDVRAQALARAAHEAFVASRDLVWLEGDDSRHTFAAMAEGKTTAPDGAPQAYVCRGQTCSLPVGTKEALAKLL